MSISTRLPLLFSCLGHAYVHLFTAFYFVIVLALEADWGLPYHELIELWTLGALLVGLGALPAGWLGDRWSAPGMMAVYFLGMGASSIACGFLDGPWALLLGLASIGLFASIYHPVGIPWLVRNAKARGKALGFNGTFGAIGIASAGLVAGALIDAYSWRAAFIVPGVICLVTGLALLACMRLGLVTNGSARASSQPPAGRGDMLKGFLLLLVTMTVVGIVFQATQTALPKVFDLRLRDLVGEGALGVGAIVAGVYAIGGVMQVAGGHLADRYPLKPVYIATFLFQGPALAAVAAFSGLPLMAVAALGVLLSVAALPAENMLLVRYTPERHQSLAFGLKFVLAFGTAPMAIWLVSAIQARTGEFVWLFLGLAMLCALAMAVSLFLPGEPGRSKAVPQAAE